MGAMGLHEGGRSTKISFSGYCSAAVFGQVRPRTASRDRPLLPSKYSWPITICSPLACSYTILPQIRAPSFRVPGNRPPHHALLGLHYSSSLSIDCLMVDHLSNFHGPAASAVVEAPSATGTTLDGESVAAQTDVTFDDVSRGTKARAPASVSVSALFSLTFSHQTHQRTQTAR